MTKTASKSATKTPAKPAAKVETKPTSKAAVKGKDKEAKPEGARSSTKIEAAKPIAKDEKKLVKKASEPPSHDSVSTKAAKVVESAAREDGAGASGDSSTLSKLKAAPPKPEPVEPVVPVMPPDEMMRFKGLLEEKRGEIIRKARQTLDEDMALDANDLPDEMDLASSEYLQSFTFRLRGREKTFLDKITKALERIKEGTFGLCEECGEEISVKRLEARPETTLCIRCKEDQERAEKDFG